MSKKRSYTDELGSDSAHTELPMRKRLRLLAHTCSKFPNTKSTSKKSSKGSKCAFKNAYRSLERCKKRSFGDLNHPNEDISCSKQTGKRRRKDVGTPKQAKIRCLKHPRGTRSSSTNLAAIQQSHHGMKPSPETTSRTKTTLLSLPTEMILEVFEATSSLSDAEALSNSCRSLNTIYHSKKTSILQTVQERTTLCYPAALRLAPILYPTATPEEIIHVIHANAEETLQMAEEAASYFTVSHRFRGIERLSRPFRPHELERLVEAWYFLKLVVHYMRLKIEAVHNQAVEKERDDLEGQLREEFPVLEPFKMHVMKDLVPFITHHMDPYVQKDLDIMDPIWMSQNELLMEEFEISTLRANGVSLAKSEWLLAQGSINDFHDRMGISDVGIEGNFRGPVKIGADENTDNYAEFNENIPPPRFCGESDEEREGKALWDWFLKL
ncbi:uncharacterized protein KY384_006620 [Bacidia gigantensis]|uniref:uncharacterized protein n=1 Tax=Bacidia gigantensis TaxID=2732470 RepID=UPI001D05183B|nr:uncharacterized protein KY384_006620 [Bacidia gigantensis]KAG8528931.1 hypothetical protein KY384_006620 [Bacidia gigantensis]